MAFLKEIKLVFATLTLVFLHQKSYSQEAKVSVSQDPKFEQLLNEKRKINSSITINDRYKIQIYNGDSENSKKTLLDFKRENKNIDICLLNHGGIRAVIPKGDVTTRTAFEVMPFENSLFVVGLKGTQIRAMGTYLLAEKKPHPLYGIQFLDSAYAYLALIAYNIMFVLPLIVIAVIAIKGNGVMAASNFIRERLHIIKLFNALLFLFIAIYYFYRLGIFGG